MNKCILGSDFEYMLRIMLLLNVIKSANASQICMVDFMAIYAKDFGIAESNLHGDNSYRFGEYFIKKYQLNNLMINLVDKGYVKRNICDKDYMYSLTNEGINIGNSMFNSYARKYRAMIREVIQSIDLKNIVKLENDIKKMMLDELEVVTYE